MNYVRQMAPAICVVLLLSGCTAGEPASDGALKSPAASPSTPVALTPQDSTWKLSVRESQGTDVIDADLAMMKLFVSFALEPTQESVRQVPFAVGGVRLGLGAELAQHLGSSELADRRAWMILRDYFRGYTGPFSPLSSIRQHVEGDNTNEPMRRSGDLQVSVGDHPHCASPPAPVPPNLESLRRVSVQPADASITTCLDWFSVDLFIGPSGDIKAVTLDLFEP